MTLTRAFFPFLTWTAAVMLLRCTADDLPPPTNLSVTWSDPVTVEVFWSWQRPRYLPDHCEIKYEYAMDRNKYGTVLTPSRHITDNCLTGEAGSHSCTYTIRAVSPTCENWTSPTINITVGEKPQAQVVRNFRCVVDRRGLNCSWIPVEPSRNVTLFYRVCGVHEKSKKTGDTCSQYYSSGERNGCYLHLPAETVDVCVRVSTEVAWNTFKAKIVVLSPKLNITRERGELKLTWETPEVGQQCWNYQFNYTKCNKPSGYKTLEKVNSITIPYDENCLYEFQSRVSTSSDCPDVNSDWSDVVTYGSNRPNDPTLTVVAIVIPIILCICVILSCHCFRKHINILCPIIPDPSAIFKEMMMNGNKDQRPGNLYTPVPEPVEPCRITPVTENSIFP